jgi:hypothetical protein
VAGLLSGLIQARAGRARKEPIVRVATKLGGIELSDWKGESRALAWYWQKRPIVLVFIRHFG